MEQRLGIDVLLRNGVELFVDSFVREVLVPIGIIELVRIVRDVVEVNRIAGVLLVILNSLQSGLLVEIAEGERGYQIANHIRSSGVDIVVVVEGR